MNGFALHPDALLDLDEIWEFIATDSIDAADRVIAECFEEIRALAPFPERGHFREDLADQTIRFTTVREYLIAYVPDARPLWVLAVLHGRRNPRTLARTLRSRNSEWPPEFSQ